MRGRERERAGKLRPAVGIDALGSPHGVLLLFCETENPFLHKLCVFGVCFLLSLDLLLPFLLLVGLGNSRGEKNKSTECLFPFDSNEKKKTKKQQTHNKNHPVLCFIIKQSGFWVCNNPPGQCGQHWNAHRNSEGELIVSLPACSPEVSPENTARFRRHCSCDKAPVKAARWSQATCWIPALRPQTK